VSKLKKKKFAVKLLLRKLARLVIHVPSISRVAPTTIPSLLVAGDLNDDGRKDVVTPNLGGRLSVLLNKTNHTLGPQISQPATNSHSLHRLFDDAKPNIAHRFQLADRVNFTKSVGIGFEHGHANKFIGSIRGVVFWYGDEQAHPMSP
jgi:hypothetical protein